MISERGSLLRSRPECDGYPTHFGSGVTARVRAGDDNQKCRARLAAFPRRSGEHLEMRVDVVDVVEHPASGVRGVTGAPYSFWP